MFSPWPATEVVRVWLPVYEGEPDEFGNPPRQTYPSDHAHDLACIVAPGDTADRIEDGHEQPVDVAYTIYLPRGFDTSLRGARATVRGETFDIVGDPKGYTEANLPYGCPFNVVARLEAHLG